MRKIFTLFLLLIPLWMQAQDDDIWDEADSTLTVTLGEGGYDSYKDHTKHLVIKAGTNSTAIGDWTFSAWPALQTVTIKKGVKTIGDSAFRENVALTSVSIEDGLESIKNNAFWGCSKLEKITIPNTVTSIGGWAFRYCSSLQSITIPADIKTIETETFYNCDGLIEVTIPEGVTIIKNNAFDFCSNLKKVIIPSTVTSIEGNAFFKCTNLTDIVYNGINEPQIADGAFSLNASDNNPINNDAIVTVPADYTGTKFGDRFSSNRIKGKEFQIHISTTADGTVTAKVGEKENVTSAGSLEEVTLNVQPEEGYLLKSLMVNGGSVTVTEDNTFIMPFGDATVAATFQKDPWDEETKTLTVILGETTEYSSYKELAEHLVIKAGTSTEIPADAFRYDWKKVEDICIESGVTTIGNYAFADCTAKTVDIPESVGSIGEGAFYACSSLTEVTIPGNVESIGKMAFLGCTALTEVTIPGNVKSIGQQAFQSCTALEKVTIEEGVENIELGAFAYCTFTEITIPESVKSIGQQAFDSCTALEKVTIKEGVESIGDWAFDVCPLLTSIVYEGKTKPTIGYAAFPTGNAGITVTVPENYDGDGFGDFSIYQIIGKTSGITITSPTHGSISAQRNGQEVASVKSGDVVKVVATPEEGYKLESLTVKDRNNDEVALTDDNTFTMPFGGVTISATFTEETTPEPEEPEEPVIPDYPDYYNIYVDECEGVTVLTSTNVVREGNSMTFTVEVAEGYTAEDMVVKVKRSLFGYTDVIEPNEEGKYEVRNIYSEIYITIEGVTEEETPTGIEELPQAKVYAKEGSLYVETPQCETVTIVSMTGAIVGQSEQIGLKRYDLPRGIYIIGIGTERYKVRI